MKGKENISLICDSWIWFIERQQPLSPVKCLVGTQFFCYVFATTLGGLVFLGHHLVVRYILTKTKGISVAMMFILNVAFDVLACLKLERKYNPANNCFVLILHVYVTVKLEWALLLKRILEDHTLVRNNARFGFNNVALS